MKRVVLGAACVLALLPSRNVRADEGTIEGVAAAERAFSALSVERGMRDAFLAFLNDSALLFRPLPINGKEMWQNRAPVPGTLIWEPSYVEVASAGDLGLSTGPWEYRPAADAPDSAIGHGHFVTMWQRDGSGSWRVAIDLGVSHAKPTRGLGSGVFVTGPSHGKPPARAAERDATLRDLMGMDQVLSAQAATQGVAKAYDRTAARDARVYREGHEPATQAKAAAALFVADAGTPTWKPWSAGVSRSGDLGYTYGVVERAAGAAPDSAGYMHVWRRLKTKDWKLTLSVENPVRRQR